ncbi:hypothetical protein CEK28_08520 [Xenophilus sp. AP218F]|nr:hypothetical protein CEK28_08520 [Xenophilus sp. AP218F]
MRQAERTASGLVQWLCRCACGREEVIRAAYLTGGRHPRTECTACLTARTCPQCGARFTATKGNSTYCSPECKRLSLLERLREPPKPRICKACGSEFLSSRPRSSCSEACHAALRAASAAAYRDRNRDTLREQWRQTAQARRDRDKETPDLALRASVRKAIERQMLRRKTDAEYRELLKTRRALYHRRKVEAAREQQRHGIDGKELRQYRQSLEHQRRYSQARRDALRQNPEAYQAYLDAMREHRHRWYIKLRNDPQRLAAWRAKQREAARQQALAGLANVGQQLIEKQETNHE